MTLESYPNPKFTGKKLVPVCTRQWPPREKKNTAGEYEYLYIMLSGIAFLARDGGNVVGGRQLEQTGIATIPIFHGGVSRIGRLAMVYQCQKL